MRCTSQWSTTPTLDRKIGLARLWQPVSIVCYLSHTRREHSHFCLCKSQVLRRCQLQDCRFGSYPFSGSLRKTKVGTCSHYFLHLLDIDTALFTSTTPLRWPGSRFRSWWSLCWFCCFASSRCRSCSKCIRHRGTHLNRGC